MEPPVPAAGPARAIALALIVLAALRPPAACADPPAVASPQLDAPSVSSAGFEPLDRAEFPPLGSVAWQGVADEGYDRQAFTVGLTPRAIARGLRGFGVPAGDSSPLLDRVAARVTVGGPLQYAHGRHALRSHRLTNHVTSELKCRLLGSGAAVLGAALDADNLGTGFGLDRYSATLIGEREGAVRLTADAGYRLVERLGPAVRRAETRLGTGASWRLFEGGARLRAVEVGLSADCLVRNHRGGDIWQDAARLDVELADALRLSASVRASSRPEMPGQDPVRFVLGLAHALGKV